MRRVLILLSVFSVSLSLQAQDNQPPQEVNTAPIEAAPPANMEEAKVLKLSILAKGSGIPLPRAEIKVSGQTLYTDPQGVVSFPYPANPNTLVVISKSGYQREEVPLSQFGAAGEYEVFLYPGTPNDDVVIVRGSRKPAISKKTVSIQEAAKVAPGGDPAQVIKLLPGVQSGNFGGEAVIRGSGPSNSIYYIDDLEVPFIFHFGNLSLVPASLLTAVEFESGGFGPEYGDATGGVIVLRTTSDIPERPRTEFVFNLPFYSGLLHTRPLSEDSALTVSVRRSYVDLFIQELVNQQAEKEGSAPMTIAPYFSDLQVSYLKKDSNGHSKYTLLAANDGIKVVVPTDMASNAEGTSSAKSYQSFVNLGMERMTRLDKDWRYTTTPQFYYYIQNSDFFGNTVDVSLTRVRMPTEFTKRLSKTEDLNVGFDPAFAQAIANIDSIQPDFEDPTFDFEDAPKREVKLSQKVVTLGTWASIDQDVGGVILTPGLRLFYNQQINKSVADPRLRVRYPVTGVHTLKGAVGQYSESPMPEQATKGWGNPDLDFIKSMHYILGVESKWNDLWNTEFQVFAKNVEGLVSSDMEKHYDNKGRLESYGAEIFIRRNLTGRLFGWLSYTYSKAREREDAGSPWVTSRYDQTHVANLVGNYKLTGTWDLGGRFNYHTGSTYNKVSNAIYNADLDKYQPRSTDSDTNAGRLPDYKSATIYARHDFLFDRWKLALRFGLETFWFKPQTEMMQYSYDYSKTEEIKGLTSVPFFELQGEF